MSNDNTIRTFLAIEIPKEILEQFERLQYRLDRSLTGVVRWAKPGSTHLTLKFFGSITERDIRSIEETLKEKAPALAPIPIAVGTMGVFPNLSKPRVLWVGITTGLKELTEMQAEIEAALETAGFPREERAYRPHLTLGRMKADRRIDGLDKAVESHKDFAAGSFTASETILFRSDLKPTGPVYTVLARFPLGA
jgi:RNA 2',3'-cyclic 3'-phosphodiesterase